MIYADTYIKRCSDCSGSGIVTGVSGDPQDCYECLGEGIIPVSFTGLADDLDEVLRDMSLPDPPLSKDRICEIYLRLRRMHDDG